MARGGMFHGGDGTERRVILYNHCRCARVMDYPTFARGKKSGEAKDTAYKADWFAKRRGLLCTLFAR